MSDIPPWAAPALILLVVLWLVAAMGAWWAVITNLSPKVPRHRARWVVSSGGGYLSGHRWRWAAITRSGGRYEVMTVEQFDREHAREQEWRP